VVITPLQLSNEEYGLLGCHVRFCDFSDTAEHVWHVLDVKPGGPAERAGLHPETDYIIGVITPSSSVDNVQEDIQGVAAAAEPPPIILAERNDLFNLIESRIGSSVRLVVYSSILDTVREVVLFPSRGWGGRGW
jgi:C-terminal processing protease CtpA/Prc